MTGRCALLFAGQGSLDVHALRSWYACDERARRWIDRALRAIDLTADRALAPTGAALRDTRAQQPLLIALQLSLIEALDEAGVTFTHAAGHSVGELSAWVAVGAMDASSTLDVAVVRGASMSALARERPGTMVALARASEQRVTDALARASQRGVAVVAARNAEDEWVLSGDAAAMREALATEGATPLDVSGAWHSPLMRPAVDAVRAALDRVDLRSETRGVLISCVTGGPERPSSLRALAASSLVEPIQWWSVTRALCDAGVRRFIIAGPGRHLRALLRRHLGACDVRLIEKSDDLRG